MPLDRIITIEQPVISRNSYGSTAASQSGDAIRPKAAGTKGKPNQPPWNHQAWRQKMNPEYDYDQDWWVGGTPCQEASIPAC